MLMWLCVLASTAILGALGWAAMNWYGAWARKRDDIEREKLQLEWKRRAAERKARAAGTAPSATPQEVEEEEEAGDNPPLY